MKGFCCSSPEKKEVQGGGEGRVVQRKPRAGRARRVDDASAGERVFLASKEKRRNPGKRSTA